MALKRNLLFYLEVLSTPRLPRCEGWQGRRKLEQIALEDFGDVVLRTGRRDFAELDAIQIEGSS